MNEAVEADGAGRQAGRRPCVDSISFWNLWLAVWRFSAKMLMALPRDQRGEELSRFMRMFIKTEHGPEAPTPAHPFDLPPCKLNTPVYLLGHFSQFVRVLSLVLSVWIRRPQPKRQSSFVCLSFATLRLCCAQLLAGNEKEKTTHCIFIYGYPPSTHYPHIHHVYICAI